MKRVFISILLLTFILFITSLLIFYVQRNSRPTILCTSLDDSIRPRNYCLMNPFRDKQPEILAEKVLQELKNGNTDIILPYLNNRSEDTKKHFLESEKKYQVEDWRIGDREDSENKISLMYWVSRQNYDGHIEAISFFFERDENEWKLKIFTAVY